MMGDIHPKRTKGEVEYGPGKPDGQQCRSCQYFEKERPETCLKVDGPIAPNMWCKLYEPGNVRLTDGDMDDDDY